jgi:PKD repeat protein
MKKNLVSDAFIGLSLFIFTSIDAQIPVSTPSGTVPTQSVTDGLNPYTGGNLGRAAGITFQFTNPDWPSFKDTCLYYGVGTALFAIINGYNTNPPNTICGNMSNLSYSPSESNPGSGFLVYNGITQYKYLYYTGAGFVAPYVPVKLFLQFSGSVYQYGNTFLKPVKGNFSYNVRILAFSPGDGMYSGGSPNTWMPAVELFDVLHTDLNTSICTQWNNGNFYTLNPTATANLTQVVCNELSNGAIQVSPSGGIGSYSYSWSNGAGTKSLNDIPAGIYTDTITDSQGCRVFNTYEITQPSKIEIEITKTDALCFKDASGTVNTIVTGGTAPYYYAWNNGDTTANLSHLTAAKYSLHLKDTNNCSLDTAISIGQPDSISLLSSVTDVSCFGFNNGSINLNPTGGTSPYTYSWSNDSTSKDIIGVLAGKYHVTVRDQNNCQIADTFIVNQPAVLSILSAVQNPSCFGFQNGSIQLSLSGGVQPYSYSWSIDSTSKDVSGLAAGTYWVSLTDHNNCKNSDTIIVTEPVALEHSFDVKNVSCFNGSDGKITLSVTGGTAPYSYLWSNDSTSKDVASLQANDYVVDVTDHNGCTFSDNTSVLEPDKLVMFLDKTDVLCYGGTSGSINTTVFGGTEPYSFNWSTGATTKDLTNLKAAGYSLLATDYNNCTINDSVSVYQPDSINILSQVNDASCFGLSDGSISITPWGGLPPYSYSWSNSAITKDLDAVPSGDYTLNFKDDNKCPVVVNLTIKQPDAFSAGFYVGDASCFNGNNGYIKLTVSGGTEPYSLLWSNEQTIADISQLTAGTYSVAVIDAHSCALTDSATVNQPGPVTSGFTFQSSEAVATFTNTSSNASYNWDFGDGYTGTDTNPVHTFSQTGVYKVCLKTYNNCDTVVSCDSVSITISTRISNAIDKNTVSIYPNPSSGFINIERTMSVVTSSWKILDQTGRTVITGEIVAGERIIQVDLSVLANGIYYLRMEQQSSSPILQKIVRL